MAKIERRIFPLEFKREVALRVVEGNERISDLTMELGIHTSVLAKWVRNQRAYGTPIAPRGSYKKKIAEAAQREQPTLPFDVPERPERPSNNQMVIQRIADIQEQLDKVTEERDALLVTLKMMMREGP